MRPTAKTATPEVVEPINCRQLVTTRGEEMLASTTVIPRMGAQRSGDFRPELSPFRIALECEVAVVAALGLHGASISKRITAGGIVSLIASATRPTAPPLVGPRIGLRTARPKTGVAEVDTISA